MKEKDFQTFFSRWIYDKKKYIREKYGNNIAFELKICKTKSIRFDSVKDHQCESLNNAKRCGCYHKINDMPFMKDNPKMRFTNRKPFDCFLMSSASAYVAIWFYKKGQKKEEREMLLVDYDDWFKIQLKSHPKKSIRENELKKISSIEKFCYF